MNKEKMPDIIWAEPLKSDSGWHDVANWYGVDAFENCTQYIKKSTINAKLDEVIDILDRAPICEVNPFEFIDQALTKLKAMRGE